MHQAPPVALALSGGGAWRIVLVVLPALAAAVIAGWLAAPLPMLAAAVAVAAAWAWRTSRPRPVLLSWNGQQWTADGAAGDVDLMLDLGRWMLLRWRCPGAPARWLPAPRAELGAAEQGLRAALYSRAGAAVQRQG